MEGSVLTVFLAVFTAVIQWFGTALGTVTSIFYANGELTIIGVPVVITFAIAVTTLVIAWVRSVMRGRG